jgi:hypothetical protein
MNHHGFSSSTPTPGGAKKIRCNFNITDNQNGINNPENTDNASLLSGQYGTNGEE